MDYPKFIVSNKKGESISTQGVDVFFLLISGPVASIFWIDEELCSDIYLDGNPLHIIYP